MVTTLYILVLSICATSGHYSRNRTEKNDQEVREKDRISIQEVWDHSDMYKTAPELIRKKGFPVEIREIITPDGYILTNHRIPKPGRHPVYLEHGIMCSSRDWLMQRGKNALPYKLAELGYDVWLGNMRGNNYSLGHVNPNMTIDTDAYWDFSVDEMSHFDVYTVIDYILNATSQLSLTWIGYSLGTTTLLAALSSDITYNSKIKFFVGMAPVAYRGHTSGILPLSLSYLTLPEEPLRKMLTKVDHGRIFPTDLLPIMYTYLPILCNPHVDFPNACGDGLALVGGYDPSEDDPEMHELIFGGFPSSTSAMVIVQQLQGIKIGAGKFRRYDFQTKETNFHRYGSPSPPDYNLTRFTVPTALFAGLNDILATPSDLAILTSQLPNVIHMENVPVPTWSHLDFVFSPDAYPLVYTRILSLMEHYSPLT